tara:strand:+ start:11930 stop:12406 length:477 start_codon:yes stop_codon:yes gene_type:complete
MAIIVEDGTGILNANSYVSAANLTAYATARGITLTASADVLILQAMDYLEAQNFIGIKTKHDQALQWPRFRVWIDEYPVQSTEMPQLLIDAECEIAIAMDNGTSPVTNITPAVKRKKVDVIEIEYKDGGASTTINRKIALKLNKLLKSNGSAFEVIKG